MVPTDLVVRNTLIFTLVTVRVQLVLIDLILESSSCRLAAWLRGVILPLILGCLLLLSLVLLLPLLALLFLLSLISLAILVLGLVLVIFLLILAAEYLVLIVGLACRVEPMLGRLSCGLFTRGLLLAHHDRLASGGLAHLSCRVILLPNFLLDCNKQMLLELVQASVCQGHF